MVKELSLSKKPNFSMGTQLVTNSPDGMTGLGPKGNQVGGKAGSALWSDAHRASMHA